MSVNNFVDSSSNLSAYGNSLLYTFSFWGLKPNFSNLAFASSSSMLKFRWYKMHSLYTMYYTNMQLISVSLIILWQYFCELSFIIPSHLDRPTIIISLMVARIQPIAFVYSKMPSHSTNGDKRANYKTALEKAGSKIVLLLHLKIYIMPGWIKSRFWIFAEFRNVLIYTMSFSFCYFIGQEMHSDWFNGFCYFQHIL